MKGNKALNAVDEHYLGLSSAIPHYNLVVDKAADFEKLYVVTKYTEGSVCEEAAGLLRETGRIPPLFNFYSNNSAQKFDFTVPQSCPRICNIFRHKKLSEQYFQLKNMKLVNM